MATRSAKKSRSERYREILASRGVLLEDCEVLAFGFERSAELFHYCLMIDRRAFYWLFDGAGKHAYVVTKKSPEYVETIREIAKECGGVGIAPDMR